MAAVGVIPALSLLIGATLGLYTGFHPWTYTWGLPLACGCAVVCFRLGAQKAVVLSLAFGFAAAGASLAADAREHALHSVLRERLDLAFGGFLIESLGPVGRHDPIPSRAVLIEDGSQRDGFVSLRADIVAVWLQGRWQSVDGGVSISVNGTSSEDRVLGWRAGRTIEAPIVYRRPARYVNDGVPDLERDLALDGVTLLGTVKSGLLIDAVRTGGLISELSADVRAHVRRAMRRWIAPYDAIAAAIASAVLIGDRTGLPDETREALQAAGTYHVIAISGGNIAILATAATVVLLIAGIRGRQAAGVAILVLIAYAAIVTAGPSVWRATVMAMLYFAARSLDQRSSAWQTASIAAALMIVARPLDVRDAGFILTFGATLALLEGARLGARLTHRMGVLSWTAASIAASLAIELALLPVAALLFSRVTAAGLVLNLLAVPLMGVVQIAALIASLADAAPMIARPSGWVAYAAARALVDSASLVALAPWSTARVPPPGVLTVALYYTALAGLFLSRHPALRAVAAAVWVSATLVVAGAIDPSRLSRSEPVPTLRLTMFDVGQGESMLIETPSGRRMLVDAGGAPFGGSVDMGARVLAPALWARGVTSLDALLITHGDPDHIGGAAAVLADFAPRQLWMGVFVPTHRPTLEVRDAAMRLGIPVEFERRGDTKADGDVRVRVLNPPVPDWERRRVRNDDSVVLELVYRDTAVLLAGDISADIERKILPRLTHTGTRILKVAHHGSRTSTSAELLSAWRPQVALISAGRGNTFGHPAADVVQRLEAIGATVLRTDLNGEITVESDGYSVVYHTGQRSNVKRQR